MTGIAALSINGRVYMAGDSAAVQDSHYLALVARPKVFTLGPAVVGYTSSFTMGHALQHRLALPDLPPSDDPDLAELDRWMAVPFMDAVRAVMRDVGYLKADCGRESGGEFLFGIRGQIYYCDDDFHASRYLAPYAACGSGVSAILGALFVGHRRRWDADPAGILIDALSAAEHCVTTVRSPFHVVATPA